MFSWAVILIGLGLVLLIWALVKFRGSKNTEAHHPVNAIKRQTSTFLGDKSTGSILEAVSDGIVAIDAHGTIKMLNSAAATLAGWNQKDATNIDHKSVFQFCDEKGKPYDEEQNPFVRVLRLGVPVRDNAAELMLKNSDKRLAISLRVSPIENNDGRTTGAVAVMRDVSEEREADRQRGEFISTASHEMRTPVAAIEGYLALAMNDKVSHIDAKAREYLAKAHDATRHLGSLFQDLLTSAKAEDGRLTSHPVIIELGSFLSNLTEELKFSAVKKNLTVEYVVGMSGAKMNSTSEETGSSRVIKPLYNVYADPERLREVITNLFDNAVKYTDFGKITIGLTGDDHIVQLFVKDSGKGIPADDMKHIFQKFYRVDNTDTRTIGGTGLGLFICRKIIEMYNGKIWAESELGKGSTFFINLPKLTSQREMEINGTSANKVIIPPSITN